jgi:DNA-binding winged helix-turn-helix (wHTH) protein/tetratricopeptide (TPR) repeat protein
MISRSYRFGRFRVSAATRELADGTRAIDLPARAFDCLVYLIEHRDRAVGRDELIAAVWGRADVSEALLNHTILKIRRALGGGGQEWIRTVPRFGYRWAGPVDEGDDESAPQVVAEAPAPKASTRWLPIAALAGAAIALTIAWQFGERRETSPSDAVDVAAPESPKEPALPALVLPAEIDAPDDWKWLRFGIMDLVANRLRSGALVTVPSESVVAMLKQRGATSGDALLADPSLGQVAALRVLPRVTFDGTRWTVKLEASGMQRAIEAAADAADPIGAAREASNRLIAKVGLTPASNAEASTPELDDLLQRSGAAMLADQLDDARKLIEAAPPGLRNAPRVQQRMAQIELRAGEYEAVAQRIDALIDRLDPKRDAALRARALITLASSHVRRNAFDKADEAYAEAIALRADAKDPEALGVAYLGRGVVLATRGRFDEAFADLGRARIELETAGDPLGAAQVDVNLGDFQAMRHRPADALPILKNAADRFEKLGAREGRVYALVAVAAAERALLDPAAALATTDKFWPPESNTSNPRMQWKAVRARAEALVANGRLGEAQTLVRRIRAESDPVRDAALRVENEAIAAEIAWLRGDERDAARLAAAAMTPSLQASDATLYVRALQLGARSLAASGRRAEAEPVVAEIKAMASAAGAADPWLRLQATLATAAHAWADQHRDEALRAYADAVQRAEQLAIPEDLVAASAAYGDALIEIGHLDEARSVAGRIATWADRDRRAAWTEVRLFRALGLAEAEHEARAAAARLGGEVPFPADLAEAQSRR